MIREGDRVVVNRGGCTCWSHESSQGWAEDGSRGTVSGSWNGHPGVTGEHHVSVQFTDRGQFVAEFAFAPAELTVVRKGSGRVVHPTSAEQGDGARREG